MFGSRFMPCAQCGASVDQTNRDGHACSRERWAEYQMFELRDEVAQLDALVRRYLTSGVGQFESWLAARQVRGRR